MTVSSQLEADSAAFLSVLRSEGWRGIVLKVVVHDAEEGGFWAEVPALPGCVTQGETIDGIRIRAKKAILGWLGVVEEPILPEGALIIEIEF